MGIISYYFNNIDGRLIDIDNGDDNNQGTSVNVELYVLSNKDGTDFDNSVADKTLKQIVENLRQILENL